MDSKEINDEMKGQIAYESDAEYRYCTPIGNP